MEGTGGAELCVVYVFVFASTTPHRGEDLGQTGEQGPGAVSGAGMILAEIEVAGKRQSQLGQG